MATHHTATARGSARTPRWAITLAAGALGLTGAPTAHALPGDFTNPPANFLEPGETLQAGQSISSPNGNVRLELAPDGNLTVSLPTGRRAEWESQSGGHSGDLEADHAVMEEDGVLAVYAKDGTRLYHTPNEGHPGSRLAVQSDGNAVIYTPDGTAVFETHTYDTKVERNGAELRTNPADWQWIHGRSPWDEGEQAPTHVAGINLTVKDTVCDGKGAYAHFQLGMSSGEITETQDRKMDAGCGQEQTWTDLDLFAAGMTLPEGSGISWVRPVVCTQDEGCKGGNVYVNPNLDHTAAANALDVSVLSKDCSHFGANVMLWSAGLAGTVGGVVGGPFVGSASAIGGYVAGGVVPDICVKATHTGTFVGYAKAIATNLTTDADTIKLYGRIGDNNASDVLLATGPLNKGRAALAVNQYLDGYNRICAELFKNGSNQPTMEACTLLTE